MSNFSKKLAVVVACVSLLGLVLLGTLSLLGLRQQARAQAFLNDVMELKLGESTFADAEQLAPTYDGRRCDIEDSCTDKECYLRFDFANPRNHLPSVLVSSVLFVGILHVKDGKLAGIELGYEADSRFGPWVAYDLHDTLLEESALHSERYEWKSPGYGVKKLKVDKDGVASVLVTRLNPHATKDERERAYAINLSCLAKVFGCNTPSAIFPPALTE